MGPKPLLSHFSGFVHNIYIALSLDIYSSVNFVIWDSCVPNVKYVNVFCGWGRSLSLGLFFVVIAVLAHPKYVWMLLIRLCLPFCWWGWNWSAVVGKHKQPVLKAIHQAFQEFKCESMGAIVLGRIHTHRICERAEWVRSAHTEWKRVADGGTGGEGKRERGRKGVRKG